MFKKKPSEMVEQVTDDQLIDRVARLQQLKIDAGAVSYCQYDWAIESILQRIDRRNQERE